MLTAVSCAKPTFCIAVGEHATSVSNLFTAPHPFAETWNGRRWRASAIRGVTGDELTGVSCPSARWCFAVGYRGVLALLGFPDAARPAAFVWSRSRWQALKAPFAYGGFTSVSCVRAANCVAVGQQGPSLGMAELWNGHAWKQLRVANP